MRQQPAPKISSAPIAMPSHHHDAKQARRPWDGRFLWREIGREREAGGLHRMQAGAHEQERETGRGALARRKPAHCESPPSRISANGMIARPPNCSMRAEPQIGHAAPAQVPSLMGVGLEPDDARGTARRSSGSEIISRDEPDRHAEFDDHHAVERADQQHHRHADGDLEQRESRSRRAERQFRRRRRRRRAGCSTPKLHPGFAPKPLIVFAGSRIVSVIRSRSPVPARCRSPSRSVRDRARHATTAAGRPPREPSQRDDAGSSTASGGNDCRRAVGAREEQFACGIHQGQRRRARREGENEARAVDTRDEAGDGRRHVRGA